ncbi:pentatricopeptide repeat-containing protein, partial [Trifolium medium]|nr:pentatricopeptide repeat-containing protein [Trifolium medium]
MRVLILGDGEMVNDEGEIVMMEVEDEEEVEEIEAECKFIGVLGSMGEYRTMKIGGRLENIDVMVLIDSGASHNFISPKLTTALGLDVKPVAERKIKLGDGHKVVTRGKSVTLQGQGDNHEKQCCLNSFLEGRQNHKEWWLHSQTQGVNHKEGVNQELEQLLKRFAAVFQDTIRLPPM